MVKLTRAPASEWDKAGKLHIPDEAIMRRAASLLDYTPGIARSQAATVATETTALSVLSSLGIRPFRDRDVEAYKRRQVWKEFFGTLRGIAICVMAAVILAAGAALITGAMIGSGALAGLAGCVGVPVMIGLVMTLTFPEDILASWRRIPLAEYGQAVPTYALELACEVKDAMNGLKDHNLDKVVFEVDRLVRERSPQGDPFLVLTIPGGTSLYLEVWDEPNFGAKRTV